MRGNDKDPGSRALIVGVGAGVVILLLALLFADVWVPAFKEWSSGIKKSTENVDYENVKMVEDTARAMISSYKSDILTYETYKDSDDKEEQSWAKQAKIRANTTANSYNEYIIKNSFIWKDNVPDDIELQLNIVE